MYNSGFSGLIRGDSDSLDLWNVLNFVSVWGMDRMAFFFWSFFLVFGLGVDFSWLDYCSRGFNATPSAQTQTQDHHKVAPHAVGKIAEFDCSCFTFVH